jgi:hypothetical protein
VKGQRGSLIFLQQGTPYPVCGTVSGSYSKENRFTDSGDTCKKQGKHDLTACLPLMRPENYSVC